MYRPKYIQYDSCNLNVTAVCTPAPTAPSRGQVENWCSQPINHWWLHAPFCRLLISRWGCSVTRQFEPSSSSFTPALFVSGFDKVFQLWSVAADTMRTVIAGFFSFIYFHEFLGVAGKILSKSILLIRDHHQFLWMHINFSFLKIYSYYLISMNGNIVIINSNESYVNFRVHVIIQFQNCCAES